MRRKSVGKRKRAPSATVIAPFLSAIPLLSDEHNATVFDSESDDDDCIHHRPEPEPEPEPGPDPVDLLDKSICICCNSKGEEGVLVCGESGCPVTVHANCIGSEPKFDDLGNFYCPYCWYKRTVDTCQQLREKAMVAKKALSGFLDNNEGGDDARGTAPCEEHVNQVRDSLEREECFEETESEETKDEGKVSVTGSSVSETNDSESEAISVRKRKSQKKVASARKSLLQQEHKHYNTRGKIAHDENEQVTSSKQPQRSPVQVVKRTSLTAKRKRLLWTAEEEKVLKEGVLKFSTENQNIPWRKILEFGCCVFDKTRTPVDLKDKWKNMTSKEGCK